MKRETFQEYLARGGKVTICPPVGKKEKRQRKSKTQGPDYDTRAMEGAPINPELIPACLKIALGIKK